MAEQKFTDTSQNNPSGEGQGLPRSLNWQNLFDNRRVLWLLGALLIVSIATTIATLQPLRPNALRQPATFSADWWLHPVETNAFKRLPVIPEKLNALAIVPGGDSTLVAVGDNGLIVRSPDGGRNWSKISVPFQAPQQQQVQQQVQEIQPKDYKKQQLKKEPAQQQEPPAQQEEPASTIPSVAHNGFLSADLVNVFFVDAQRGWTVGDDGVVLATGDGGTTWQAQDSGARLRINSIQFIDAQRGWAVGDEGTVLATSDGGANWQAQRSGTTELLNSVQFVDAQRGWAVGGNGAVFATSNGGTSWQAQDSGTTSTLYSVQFIDALRGWAVGDAGTALTTSDGGASWQAQDSGITSTLHSVRFVDAQRGWAVGGSSTVLATSDGGANWQAQSSGTASWLHAVQFIDAQRGWAVGDAGTVLATSDGGFSWQARSSGTNSWLHSVQFLDTQRGWAVGDDGTVLTTSDGGASWLAQKSGTINFLNWLWFIDAQRGWAVGENGIVIATSDGGFSWQAQDSGTKDTLRAVQFVDARRGWATGYNGTVLTTTDGGASWQARDSSTRNTLFSTQFIDTQRGWAVGDAGTMLSTSDGGASWQAQVSGTTSTLFSVQFLNEQRGWAVGRNGTVLATNDGGARWQPQDSGTSIRLQSVQFIDAQRGWTVGDAGTVLTSSDGGANWQAQSSGTTFRLHSVQFIDAQHGWAVGRRGTALATTDGGANWVDITPLRYPAPWYYLSWLAALILFLPALNPKSRRIREPTGEINTIANQVTSDRPLQENDQDRLGFGRIARSVSRFLRHEKTTGPLTLAVSGRWGTGKSSLMNLISADLQRHGFVPVWFNSWHHQSEENLIEALVTSIRQQGRQPFFTSRPPFVNPYWFAFLFRRLFRWSAEHYLQILLLVCTATVALTFYGHDQSRLSTHIAQIQQLVNPAETPLPGTDNEAVVKEISSTAVTEQEGNKEITRIETEETIAAKPAQEAPEPAAPVFGENIDWIVGLLSSLIALAGGPVVLVKALQTLPRVQSRAKNLEFRGQYARYFRNFNDNLRPVSLIVFIDDLDRCDTSTVMRALEATNYLVSSGNCFVILGMDYNIVRNSVAVGYDSLTKKIAEDHGEEGKAAFANEYLEKLINIQLEVPELETTQMLDLALPDTHTEDTSTSELLAQRLHQYWMQYWRLIFLAGVVVAGVQLGNYLHALAGTAKTVAPVQSSQKPTDPAQLQPEAEVLQGAVAVEEVPGPGRAPAGKIISPAVTDNTIDYIYLPIAVIVLVGIWVMMRGRDDIQYDSSTFEQALGIWLPLASRRRDTPRAVKRFVNRTRYFAMRLRDEREISKTERDDEATIVALSAILQINPDAIDLPADEVLAGIARLEKMDTILKPETFDATVELIGQMADQAINQHDEAFQTSLAEQIQYTLPLFREISKGIQIK